MARSTLHEKLAEEFGGHAAIALRDSLPRIAEAAKTGRQASFTVTAEFKATADGSLVLEIKPRERIPLESKRFKLRLAGHQLALLGEDASEDAQDAGGE